MTTTRIILKQGGVQYRFLRCEALPDGSLVILIDRVPTPKRGGLQFRNGVIKPDSRGEGKVLHKGKFTCHTTGQINRYVGGAAEPEIIYGEPLFDLTQPQVVGFYSIPRFTKLDKFSPNLSEGSVVTIDISNDADGHFSSLIMLLPNDYLASLPFRIQLRYELYTLQICPYDFLVPDEMQDHFIVGSPNIGSSDHRRIDPPSAELSFYKKVFRGGRPIFRERSGAYLMLAEVPMRVPPVLTVEFDSPKFCAEQIDITGSAPTTHKVRFWIKDKGGRNKTEDLREHIVSATLDAEI